MLPDVSVKLIEPQHRSFFVPMPASA